MMVGNFIPYLFIVFCDATAITRKVSLVRQNKNSLRVRHMVLAETWQEALHRRTGGRRGREELQEQLLRQTEAM